MEKPKPILTIQLPNGGKYELYLLNVGEKFPGFGGSSAGLVAGENQPRGLKTASLIVRHVSPWGCNDSEFNIYHEATWAWVQKFVTAGIPFVVKEAP